MVCNGESAAFVELRELLLRYLERHPHAADTLEGIRVWWLDGIQKAPPAEVLQEVLNEMVAAGMAAHVALVNGSIVYGKIRNPRNVEMYGEPQ